MDNNPIYHKFKHIRCPLTPYQLFSPVSSVFLNNLTQEDQILGLYNQFNQFITRFNQLLNVVEEMSKIVDAVPDQIADMQNTINNFITLYTQKFVELAEAVATGDQNTLAAAKQYTDQEIAKITPGGGGGNGIAYGALTASQYDSLGLAAVDYDDYNLTAFTYDYYAKYYLLGADGSIYLKFLPSVNVNALETVFDLANPPVELNKRYEITISLGNFSLDGNEPAHLEIVGNNTLGNTLPITVPSGGSATVVAIWTEKPTIVRGMSSQTQVTGYNAFIKIKPLGEI